MPAIKIWILLYTLTLYCYNIIYYIGFYVIKFRKIDRELQIFILLGWFKKKHAMCNGCNVFNNLCGSDDCQS